MSFGISGDPHHSQMVGGDVAVAWVDKATLKGAAEDYYLDAKSQCAGVSGSCPDERLVVSPRYHHQPVAFFSPLAKFSLLRANPIYDVVST